MDASPYFTGKKITLMRIGLLGRGVGDAAFLARNGAEVLVVDSAPQTEMQASVDALSAYPNIRFKFGPYDLEDFRNCDLVLKGAGTPLHSPEIAAAHAAGIPVRMSADLFAELSGVTCVGITGTRGKSTTTHMIAAVLERAGKQVLLGGNVRGMSTLALLDEVAAEEAERAKQIGVLELDSWQLQGFGEAKRSPQVAVFTTFFRDHMNYYLDDMDAYLADKANIFLYQKLDDMLILGSQCEGVVLDRYAAQIRGKYEVWGESALPREWKLQIPGAHNRYDAALALGVARVLGVADETAREALEAFAGVPGRLELVRTADGVDYYNDTNATTPDATLAALEALSTKPLILIMGGADKGLDMSPLIEKTKNVRRVILLSGTGTERIKTELPDAPVFDNLAAAFNDAKAHAQLGDAIVLSPAFASFGMFRNEYDRGDQFNALVQSL